MNATPIPTLSDQMLTYQPTPLLTATDVAAILRCNRSHAYKLLETGAIQAVKFGKCVRTTPQAITDFINRSTLK